MRRLAVVSLLTTVALAANSGVQELKKLVISAKSSGDSDKKIGNKISEFPIKERLTEGALADIRALSLGPVATEKLGLLADVSEFEPAAPSSLPPLADVDALLAKARNFALNYIENLPNFLCTSTIRRFETTSSLTWMDNVGFLSVLKFQDTETTEVSFDHGKESYHRQSQTAPVKGFSTSGEFGSILGSILIAASNTVFPSSTQTLD